MTAWLKLLPTWGWTALGGLVLALAVSIGQQIRVNSLKGDLAAERDARIEDAGKLGACRATRVNMEALVGEQNQAIADLSALAQQRREVARRAQRDAQQGALADYQAANRLQQERTGGDACAAAEAVIDRELGL